MAVATVITMYLLPEVNLQLRPALLALKPGTRIVSHDWDLGDWNPDRAITVDAPDKPVGLDKRSSLRPRVVPAQIEGLWCGIGPHSGARLRLAQRFQHFVGTLALGGSSQELAGRIDGLRLQTANGFEAAVSGARLHIGRHGALPAALRGDDFERGVG